MNTKISHYVTFMATSIAMSTAGHAFTLGDLRGSANLGQPLDVSVSIEAGEGETVSDDCLSAKLFFGDFPQATPNLRLQKPATDAASTSMVRVRSTVAVNEPIVTVVLRATCGTNTSRRYVLLTDFPAVELPAIHAAPAAQSAALTSPVQKAASPVVTDLQQPSTSKLAAAKTPVPTRTARPKPARVAVAASTTNSSSALHLVSPAPPDAASAAQPDTGHLDLKLESELVFLSHDELAALVNRRVSLPTLEPEADALAQSAKLEALQKELKSFKELTTKNQAALSGLEAKLSQAETERAPMSWLYVLVGLLVAALGALAWVLRQQQNVKKAWWDQAGHDTAETIGLASSATPSEPATVSEPTIDLQAPAAPAVQQVPPVDLDFDLDDLGTTAVSAPVTVPLADTLPNPFGITCDLDSETISDIRQQAEFFVSLGQVPRAIELLRRQIDESAEPHPLMCLDLLTLYHSQGMKVEFRKMRLDFNRSFNTVVPDFPNFHNEGQGLLEYPATLAELIRAWPNWEASALLEAFIFRSDSTGPQLGFDLAAFRDLLLLRTLVDKAKVGSASIQAKPLGVNEPQIHTVDSSRPDVMPHTNSYAPDLSTQPDAMLLIPSGWASLSEAPTTEELEREFPIDILKTTKRPGH